MKAKLLLIAILFLSIKGYNQTWQWTHPEPNGNLTQAQNDSTDNDIATQVVTDSIGNVYVLGDFHDSLFLNNIYRAKGDGSYLAKYDSTGKLLWYKLVVPASTNYNSYITATSLVVNSNGVYITGTYKPSYAIYDCQTHTESGNNLSYLIGSYSFTSSTTEIGFFVTKLNFNGGVTWNKIGTDYSCYDIDGNLYYNQPGAVNYNPIITSDKSNNIICSFVYYANQNSQVNSNLYIGANKIILSNNLSATQIFQVIIKYNTQGTFQWSNYAGGGSPNNSGNYLGSVYTVISSTTDSKGNIFFYGQAGDSTTFGSKLFRSHPNGSGIGDYVAKLSSIGTWQFVENICDYQGNASGTANSGYYVDCHLLTTDTANNLYAIVNLTGYNPGYLLGNIVPTEKTTNYLVKMNNNGTLQWYKGFGTAGNGGNPNAIAYANNSLYIAGELYNETQTNAPPWYFSALTVKPASLNGIDYYVAKADINGNFQWVTSFTGEGGFMEGLAISAINGNVYTAGFYNPDITTLGNLSGNYVGTNWNLFFGKLKDQYIRVGAATPITLCPGSNITIPFTSYGLTFSGSNKFKAELSNASGDFTTPIVIGTTTSTGTGGIAATIPNALPYGNGYAVRIRSTDTLKTGYNYYAYADTNYRITLLCPAPSSGFDATNITGTSATVNWNVVDCAKGYRVQYRIIGTSKWTTVTTNTNTGSLNITGITVNTTYQWRVATKCKPQTTIYFSDYSKVKQFTTAASFAVTADNISAQTKTSLIKVYPNPANNNAVIIYTTTKAGKYSVELTDVLGKVLKKINGEATAGENKITLKVSNYAQGMYIINLTDDEHGKQTLKLNKQ